MFNNIKFQYKIALLVGVLLAFSAIIAAGYHSMALDVRAIGVKQSSDAMLDGYKSELKDIVDVMAQTLSSATQDIDEEQAVHDTFTNLVKDARFFPDKSGYYFIYKMGGTVFVHAAKPEIEGKDLHDLRDTNGTLLIQELEKVAVAGGGYVNYLWDKPGKGVQPKLSYCKMIPGKPYWIGTGVYIDDIQEKEAAILGAITTFSNDFLQKLYFILAVVFFLVIAPWAIFIIKSMINPLDKLTDAANKYSLGDLDAQLSSLDRDDEIGQLAKALNRLGASTKLVMRKLIEERNK